jgi:small subunit ribosomal protein S3
MGQKVNPIGLRLGIIKGWDSNWYGVKTFSSKLIEDQNIRKYVEARIPKGGVQINIYEIKRPELDARLVGESIAQQIRARISYRRAMKQAIASAMRVGAQGIKIKVSGRLGGAEMARTEQYKEGRIPLHTLRANIDYAISESNTVYGKIGIKVWIFKGEVYGKRDLSPNIGMSGTGSGNGGGRRKRGDNPRRRRR